jgi:hypothetical protein
MACPRYGPSLITRSFQSFWLLEKVRQYSLRHCRDIKDYDAMTNFTAENVAPLLKRVQEFYTKQFPGCTVPTTGPRSSLCWYTPVDLTFTALGQNNNRLAEHTFTQNAKGQFIATAEVRFQEDPKYGQTYIAFNTGNVLFSTPDDALDYQFGEISKFLWTFLHVDTDPVRWFHQAQDMRAAIAQRISQLFDNYRWDRETSRIKTITIPTDIDLTKFGNMTDSEIKDEIYRQLRRQLIETADANYAERVFRNTYERIIESLGPVNP